MSHQTSRNAASHFTRCAPKAPKSQPCLGDTYTAPHLPVSRLDTAQRRNEQTTSSPTCGGRASDP
eukprot:6484252-Prymnesium_polylepis.1